MSNVILNDLILQIKELSEKVESLRCSANRYYLSYLVSHVHESDGKCYLSNPPHYKCKLCGELYE